MESNPDLEIVGFGFLRRRLLETVRYRICSGEYTERGFARMIGISQPQVHNILKGARNLSPETADLILAKLGMSIFDLLGSVDRPQATPPTNLTPIIPIMAVARAAAVGASSCVIRKPPTTEQQRGGQSVGQMGS
jgi:transcriptional regulator with XRE-family HTH domain